MTVQPTSESSKFPMSSTETSITHLLFPVTKMNLQNDDETDDSCSTQCGQNLNLTHVGLGIIIALPLGMLIGWKLTLRFSNRKSKKII
jgi:hypothetical protein